MSGGSTTTVCQLEMSGIHECIMQKRMGKKPKTMLKERCHKHRRPDTVNLLTIFGWRFHSFIFFCLPFIKLFLSNLFRIFKICYYLIVNTLFPLEDWLRRWLQLRGDGWMTFLNWLFCCCCCWWYSDGLFIYCIHFVLFAFDWFLLHFGKLKLALSNNAENTITTITKVATTYSRHQYKKENNVKNVMNWCSTLAQWGILK